MYTQMNILKGYRCKSGIALFAFSVFWNFAYSPFKYTFFSAKGAL